MNSTGDNEWSASAEGVSSYLRLPRHRAADGQPLRVRCGAWEWVTASQPGDRRHINMAGNVPLAANRKPGPRQVTKAGRDDRNRMAILW